VHGRNELGLAPDEYAGFSMTLLRLLAFRPVAAGAANGGSNAPVATPRAAGRATPAVAPFVAPATAPVSRPAAAMQQASAAPMSAAASGRAAALQAARAGSGKGGSRAAAAPVPVPVVAAPPPAPLPPVDEMPPPWDEEPGAGAAQKKTEQHSSSIAFNNQPDAITQPVVVVPPPVTNPITPAIAAQTAKVAAALGWNGNWPQLAADLPLRGMPQQMAKQSELIRCEMNGNTVCFYLRIPVEMLRAAGNVERLSVVLGEHFNRSVRVETDIGMVANTANARAEADRAERQREAELMMQQDPFVQAMIRDFGASIVQGSIRPL
jgi:DNA polymerase-3 subunit gamma/tau